MKIDLLSISNIMSFRHYENLDDAEKIQFLDAVNIIIGENGSGKSTLLEVVNFVFKRVLFKAYNVNREYYNRRRTLPGAEQKQILNFVDNAGTVGFRLDPNWDFEGKPQNIRIRISLDEIDYNNIDILHDALPKLISFIGPYTNRGPMNRESRSPAYMLDISLRRESNSFSVRVVEGAEDFGLEYLMDYHFFKEAIALHNAENESGRLTQLDEPFTLVNSYRNYHSFQTAVSLRDQEPSVQIQQIVLNDFSRSINMADQSEPPIFALVRLRVAEKHFSTIKEKLSEEERVILANNLPFLQEINRRIAILNLECRIVCSEHRTWQYSFRFFDKRRGRNLDDINSLSAGQKAIIHLVFESYGKGELRGGVVIIDEPEVHLHYQFQSEYLRVVGDLHKNEKCQYIIVTHSEALINSETINFTSRFYLDDDGYTKIKSAQSDPDFESLIKILDNTRSTYAFFAKTVALVEGETDRYFFKAVIQRLHGEASQMIAVLDINGKPNFERWAGFFSKFGLRVFQVADFDYIIQRAYPQEKQKKMIRKKVIDDFKANHSDWEEKVDLQKASNLFILKEGGLENYIDVPSKGLVHVVAFCNKRLGLFLESGSKKSQEIRDIARAICG